MPYSQSEIDVFVSKLLEIQRHQSSSGLSREDRKELAMGIGVSEADWLEFENDFDGYIQRGHTFRQGGNDDDAITEYTAAFIIDPYHEELLSGLTRAHARRYRHQRQEADKEAAERYARRLLEINPKNQRAASIINELKDSGSYPMVVLVATFLGAGIGIVLGFAMRRIGLGVVIGAAAGLAVGLLISQLRKHRLSKM